MINQLTIPYLQLDNAHVAISKWCFCIGVCACDHRAAPLQRQLGHGFSCYPGGRAFHFSTPSTTSQPRMSEH